MLEDLTLEMMGYHSATRSRQNLWVDGKQVELDPKDPGGEHE